MRLALCAAVLLLSTGAHAAPVAKPQAPAAPAVPAIAQAPVFQAGINRVELITVLTANGLTVKDATTKDSDPWLTARTAKGTEFYVNMYDCEGTGAQGRRCSNLQFLAQWELTKNANVDSANTYNQRFVFGRAYLNKDGTMFMFDYSMNIKDGVTAGNLKRHVDNWLRVLDDVRALLKV